MTPIEVSTAVKTPNWRRTMLMPHRASKPTASTVPSSAKRLRPAGPSTRCMPLASTCTVKAASIAEAVSRMSAKAMAGAQGMPFRTSTGMTVGPITEIPVITPVRTMALRATCPVMGSKR
jgi:hypothetical protein